LLLFSEKSCIFVADSRVHCPESNSKYEQEGRGSKEFVGKGRLRNVIFFVRISQIQCAGRNATRASTLGVLYPVCLFIWQAVAICHDVGYLELLILAQGYARALTWDKREVEHPTSFRFTLFNC